MTDALAESNAPSPPLELPTRPLYWSVWREVWENRSIYLAPLAVAGVYFFGFALSTIGQAHRRKALLLLDEAHQRAAIVRPFDMAATVLFFTAFLVAFFYCLDALYGERRDRSILFWKSLPVSDRTTVLTKASIPLLVLPAITCAIILALQLVMLLWSSMMLLAGGVSPASTFRYFHWLGGSFIVVYGFIVIALWHAPIYAWLLMISAWVKRATFLWALLPWFALAILEKVAFNTGLVPFAIGYRLFGGVKEAFAFDAEGQVNTLGQLRPDRFFAQPGLWTGFAFAALFLFIAMRLRRDREAI